MTVAAATTTVRLLILIYLVIVIDAKDRWLPVLSAANVHIVMACMQVTVLEGCANDEQ
jgi:hypothetical protein